MQAKPNFFLITTGTSVLINHADKNERDLVFRYANTRKLSDIPKDDAHKLQDLCRRSEKDMLSSSVDIGRERSAELNSLLAYYGGSPSERDTLCFLITDTWLAEQSFQILKKWLETKFSPHPTIYSICIPDLQTASEKALQIALSDLVKVITDELSNLKNNAHIVFNVTGGFKVILAFLQTLGQFYADEIIYLFESSQELMRIPRLPLKWEPAKVISENFVTLRKLALGLNVSESELAKIPGTLLFRLNGQVTLSPWGNLVFKACQDQLYCEKLHESPCDKIVFTNTFCRSVENLQPNRLKEINTRIDDLVRFHCCQKENPKRLDFKKLKSNHPKYTHEFDAWSDEDARRVFCRVEGDKIYLIELAKGLH